MPWREVYVLALSSGPLFSMATRNTSQTCSPSLTRFVGVHLMECVKEVDYGIWFVLGPEDEGMLVLRMWLLLRSR